METAPARGGVVLHRIKRLFGRGHQGPASVSPEEAEVRLKGLKGRLMKNKTESKRLFSELERAKHLDPGQKAAHKARLKELDAEKKDILSDMKALQKRLPKK